MDVFNNYECDGQMSIFDWVNREKKPIKAGNKKVRLIELFAGIGSQALCLEELGVDFETYKVVEFDDYCIQSYNAIHSTNFTKTDIRDVKGEDLEIVDTDKYFYIFVYSFPCQDISIAGHLKGCSKGSGSRSSLLWEVERILNECYELHRNNPKYGMPQVLLMENVKNLVGKQNIADFSLWKGYLESIGYGVNEYSILNAKDYGIPQNRERVFMLSVWGSDYTYKFPEPIELKKSAVEYLEDEVEEKYFTNSDRAVMLLEKLAYNGTLEQIRENWGGGKKHQTIIDMTLKDTQVRDVVNTISARQDRGVSTRRQEGTGVIEEKK